MNQVRCFFAFALWALVVLPARGQGPPPAPVRVDAVRTEEVQVRRGVTGELRAVHRADVASREFGLVTELMVEEGQRVGKGDVLARLDSRRLEIELRMLEAEERVAQAVRAQREAEARLWRDEVASLTDAVRKGGANPKELGDAQTTLAAAEAALTQAEQQIPVIEAQADLVKTRLGDMTITAPFDSVVVERHADVGEWLGEGDAVVRIVDVTNLEAWLLIDQRFLGPVSMPDPRVTVRPEVGLVGDEPLTLTRVRIIPSVDRTARSFYLVGRIDAGENSGPDLAAALAPGVSVTGQIPTGQRAEHLTVDKDAILRGATGPYVYVVREGEGGAPATVTQSSIDVIFELADRVAVRPGSLQSGDRVVIEGNERLFPTAPVTIVSGQNPPPAAASDPGAGDKEAS